jgi:glycosyltransferase involved in cell wall biosynthesis
MFNKIKILYLDHTSKWGGGEVAIFNLICALDKSRFAPVVVLASDGLLADRLRESLIETYVLPISEAILETRKDSIGVKSLFKINQVFELLKYSFRLADFAKKNKITIIHTNSLKSDLYGGFAGRIAKIPVIWHIRDNITSDYLPSLVAFAFRKLARIIPTLVVANSESTLKNLGEIEKSRRGILYSGTTAQAEQHQEQPLLGEFQDLGSLQIPESPVITLVGRIAEWKGQHIAIEALADVVKIYPTAKLRIVGSAMFGENDYESLIRKQVEDLGLDNNVEFLGFRNDVQDLLKASDIVLHASTIGEPFGQVVVEGMAAQKPVIATDGGALPEIVIPGVTGLLVPLGDSQAMAKAIKSLVADPVLCKNMGIAGKKRVNEKFTISHTVKKAEEIYLSVLKKDGIGYTIITDGVGMEYMDKM